jgi:hypothetical protein
MKKLLVSAVLSAMLASPAFAHSYNAGYGTGNLINLPALEHDGPSASAGEAYASAPLRASAQHLRHARTQETTCQTILTRSTTNPASMSAGIRIRMSGSSCVATTHMITKSKM